MSMPGLGTNADLRVCSRRRRRVYLIDIDVISEVREGQRQYGSSSLLRRCRRHCGDPEPNRGPEQQLAAGHRIGPDGWRT